MSFRGYTFAMRPTPDQEVRLEQSVGVCRLIWNLALEQRRDHWRRYQASTGNTLNYIAQARELTALRAEEEFIREISQTAQQRTLKDLDAAFKKFFSGQAGFPKFKKKGSGDAFSFTGREVSIQRINLRWGRVRLPKVGWVKFRMSREVGTDIREGAVTRTALGWQVSFVCPFKCSSFDNGRTVGIDRGVTVPLMLSDGSSYLLPEQIGLLDRKYKKAQKIAARRKKGSSRWRKAMLRASRIKSKQARVRKHWAHVTTTDITKNYGGVVLERLRVSSLTKSASGTVENPGRNVSQKRGLNRSIMNVGWHQIESMLFYKAHRVTKVNPAYTSQTCALCGVVDSRSRKSQAEFVCTGCGNTDNADKNAAIVILNRGNTPGVEALNDNAFEARTLYAAPAA